MPGRPAKGSGVGKQQWKSPFFTITPGMRKASDRRCSMKVCPSEFSVTCSLKQGPGTRRGRTGPASSVTKAGGVAVMSEAVIARDDTKGVGERGGQRHRAGAHAAAGAGQASRGPPQEEPVSLPRIREPLGEGKAAHGVAFVEPRYRWEEHHLRVGAQVVEHGDTVSGQCAAGPHEVPRRRGGIGVADQRAQSATAGAHAPHRHMVVEPVVGLSTGSEARAQVLHLWGRNDQHGQFSGPACFDDVSVGTIDADLRVGGGEQAGQQRCECGGVSGDGELLQPLVLVTDEARGRGVPGAVHAAAGALRGWGVLGPERGHLTVGRMGRHPVLPGHDNRSLAHHCCVVLCPVSASRGVLGQRCAQASFRWPDVERTPQSSGGDHAYARESSANPGRGRLAR